MHYNILSVINLSDKVVGKNEVGDDANGGQEVAKPDAGDIFFEDTEGEKEDREAGKEIGSRRKWEEKNQTSNHEKPAIHRMKRWMLLIDHASWPNKFFKPFHELK